MEHKHMIIIAFVVITLISLIIARGNNEEIAKDPMTSFFDIEINTISGDTIKMESYKGKKILIVNVASKCGLTPQYEQLESLYKKYSEKLIILAFPSNDFLGQEPGSNEEIQSFCASNYSISFPLFEKSKVKGRNKNIIYDWLTDPQKNGWNKKGPSWNFTKYLINEDGKLINRFSPRTSPLSTEIISKL